MQPAAYCYQILRCAAAATTGASGPLVPTTYACLSIFCHKLPACASVSTLPSFSPMMSLHCGETQQQTAAAAGLDWAVTGSSAAARLYRLLYTASDNYNEARCWENIMGGGLRSYSVL